MTSQPQQQRTFIQTNSCRQTNERQTIFTSLWGNRHPPPQECNEVSFFMTSEISFTSSHGNENLQTKKTKVGQALQLYLLQYRQLSTLSSEPAKETKRLRRLTFIYSAVTCLAFCLRTALSSDPSAVAFVSSISTA